MDTVRGDSITERGLACPPCQPSFTSPGSRSPNSIGYRVSAGRRSRASHTGGRDSADKPQKSWRECSTWRRRNSCELHLPDPQRRRCFAFPRDRYSMWGKTRRAEEDLPELLSRLIRCELFTADGIRAPSGERIIERGPDIAVSTRLATRHIPAGRSVWEVSTAGDFRRKARKDLNRRRVPAGWRRDATSFVFVTTESLGRRQ